MKKIWKLIAMTAAIVMSVSGMAFASPAEGEEKDFLQEADVYYLGADYFAESGEEIAKYIAEQENGTYTVDALPGSTISGTEDTSYVSRAEAISDEEKKLLVIELPGNDLAAGVEIGSFDDLMDESAYDRETVTGAMESILSTAQARKFVSVLVIPPEAEGMDELLAEVQALQEKWGYLIVDLRGVEDVNPYLLEEIVSYLREIRFTSRFMFRYAGCLPQFDPENYPVDENSPLKGLNIIQLGSSVTAGQGGYSFVEYIAHMTGSTYVKEAVPGTTMSNYEPLGIETSYISRMKANLDPEMHADLFVCQLSTNDASKRVEPGQISDSDNPEDFDLETVAGAIEYIIHYVQDTWHCPIMFYTGTDYGNENYAAMVDVLLSMQEKYEIGIIDMYHNLDTDFPLYTQYMAFDGIHPTNRGYAEWWAPYMIECMTAYLQEKGVLASEDAAAEEALADPDAEAAEDTAAEDTAADLGNAIEISADSGSVKIEYYDGTEIVEASEDGDTYVSVPEGMTLDHINVYAAEGGIDIIGVIADSYDLETVHGDMNIYLPEDTAFHVQLSTISDIFESDFMYDVTMQRHEYIYGEDGVDIQMETIIGAARVMKLES